MIFEIYVASLVVGGGLLAFSALFGGDHDSDGDMDLDHDADFDVDHDVDFDVDHDADFDVDHDADFDADHGVDGALVPAVMEHGGELAEAGLPWLPFLTLRFWTFGITFFGLFGTLATLLSVGTPAVVLGISSGVGALSGGLASSVIRYLRQNQVSSSVREEEWSGAQALVLLPISPERAGKVRVVIRGRTLDRKAVSRHQVLSPGDQALVVEDQGDLVVVEGLSKV